MSAKPSTQDVAALVRARTRDQFGAELGDFSAETRPTAAEVARLIDQEAGIVSLHAGDLETLGCPDASSIQAGAAALIAKRVAAIVEASYRPDELAEGRTVADFYEGQMEDDMAALAAAARSCRAWQPGADGTDGAAQPVAYFPPACPMRW